MKTQHTPGPWENKNGNISGKWGKQDIGIAIVGTTRFCGDDAGGPKDKRMRSEDKANARLIAAAPELLAALAKAVDCMVCYIPKAAKGYKEGCFKYVAGGSDMWNCECAICQARAAIAKAGGQCAAGDRV
jgi:hypothetical protein